MNIRRGLILTGMLLVFTAPVAAQQPRDDNYTALAQAHLAEAQTEEDEATAMAAYERALAIAQDGISNNPENPKSFFYAGIALIGLERYAEADEMFDTAERMYPEYFNEEDQGTELYRENGWIEAYNSAITELEAGNETGAIEMFNNANLIYDRRPEAYLNLGATLANTGDLDGAIAAYERAIATIDGAEAEGHHPDDLPQWQNYRQTARINVAQIMMGNDQAAEAVAVLEAVLEEDPDNADARTNLAVALARSGQAGDATGIYDDIIAAPESSAVDLYNAGVGLYQSEHYAKAVEAFEAALGKSPLFRDALQNLTQSMTQAANDDETYWERILPYSEKLVEIDPNNELAYRIHGIALARSGDSDAAIAVSEQRDALPFHVQQLQLRPAGGGVQVVGAMVNQTLEQGADVRIRFMFYDASGNEIGSEEFQGNAPAQGEAVVISVDFDGAAAGYAYEVSGD